MWSETAISKALEGRFYQLQQKSLGSFSVVNVNEPEPEPEAPVIEVVSAPVVAAEPMVWPEPRRRKDGGLWLDDIARVVCPEFGINRLELVGVRRAVNLVNARQSFFWIAKNFTGISFIQIGLWCNRDHTTVMHAVRKIDRRFDEYQQRIEQCLSRLGVSLEQEAA